MSAVEIAQVPIGLPAAVRWFRTFWPAGGPWARDEGFLVKSALTELFGTEAAPRPWRVQTRLDDGRVLVVGYTRHDAHALRERAMLALPGLRAAVDADAIVTAPLAVPAAGRRVQGWVSLCPTRRTELAADGTVAGRRRELDAFLAEVEQAGREGRPPRSREEVYADYLRRALDGALQVGPVAVRAFTIARMARKDGDGRPTRQIEFPSALLQFEGTVADAGLLRERMAQGIGRARAFGHGMLLLRPAGGMG
jgi:hypothetical protein